MAAPMAARSMRPVRGSTETTWPAAMCVQLAFQKAARLALTATAFAPTMKPSRMSPDRATVLVTVKTPWIVLPVRTPRMLRYVRTMMLAMARTWAAVIFRPRTWVRTCFSLNQGMISPVNLAKATPTAAIVPVWMTRKVVHP